ncbi:cytochrome c biogenesis protein CcdA [Halocatena pleomorpha]|uniref:Cytochrome C biogenesis protein n=1 Tax=Halocatena pleomorpha TaxID=1785090 RepID=A0A3P3RAV5_9EURY|nr:cytochrome c biogenesis protein CcdA [Halocatena pleomorpha]RRJ29563.1 cytochrome C biogenesis protein [Halocatena pleomorpha]
MSEAALLTNLSFALTAGVATFFSPCAYPLLSGYVGFYIKRADSDEISLASTSVRGIAAGTGVLVTFGILTGTTVWIGRSVLSNIMFFESLVGVLLIIFGGFAVTGYAPSISASLPKRRSSVLGFGVFGAGYALAGAGCVAPIFLAVIARSMALPTGTASFVVLTYATVVSVLMVSVTVATGMGLLRGASRLTTYSGRLKQLTGIVMIISVIGQIYLTLVVY